MKSSQQAQSKKPQYTLDGIFEELSTKIDLHKGFDKTLMEQKKVCEIQQKLHQEETIQNQILIQQCLQLRAHISKEAYRDLMFIFGYSYNQTNNGGGTGQQEGEITEKNEDFERAKKVFKEDIQPTLMANIQNICMHLRRVLLIAEGQTTEEIMDLESKLSNDDANIDLSQLPSIHEQLQKMEAQIVKVKEILQKTKELKQELKIEILDMDESIDRHLHNIGLLIDSVDDSYDAKIKLLNAQTENLSISKLVQAQEFEEKTFDGLKANKIYKEVQSMLDAKIEEQKVQQSVLQKQLDMYEKMDASERLELQRIARDYEAMMLQRIMLEKETSAQNSNQGN